MDPFHRRSTLNVGDVAFQGFGEEAPRAGPIAPRQHPGVDDAAQRRAIRGPPHVIGDVVAEDVRLKRIAERCDKVVRSEEHTSELQSLMRISYAVFCLKKKKIKNRTHYTTR